MSIPGPVALAHVARLHYLRELSKQEIAERLGISRFKVARLIEQAKAEGVVRFEVRDPVRTDDALSRGLEEAFGLELAIVVDDENSVAAATAAWLPELLDGDPRPVGVGWGATLARVPALLPAIARGGEVVQVCGAVAGLQPGTSPVELALRFAERLGARAQVLPAPALAGRGTRSALLADPTVRPTVRLFERLGVTLVGIGAGSRFPGAPRRAVGHILTHVFDASGELVPVRTAQRAIALSAAQLRRAKVVAAAGGAKEAAVLGALRGGLVNVLVTDARNAAHALEAHSAR